MPVTFRLGIDLGTSTTVAVLAGPDGHPRTLLFDASPLPMYLADLSTYRLLAVNEAALAKLQAED